MLKSQPLPIVILNWNNYSDTKECIKSILKNTGDYFRIYLLDNNSDEEEINSLKNAYANHPQIKLSLNKTNLGFAKAHNLILEQLFEQDYQYVFLLNNDTIITAESLSFINQYLISNETGMLSCKMINYWNHDLMDNAGHKMLSSGEIIPIGHGDSVQNCNTVNENIGACAGAAIYSTKMLKDVGLFDEYFETGYEDAELGLRAFIAGYKCLYEPNAIIYHKMGQSIKKIFNYQYTLKTQTNIFYTYLKLVHWQVMIINFIPWILRFFIITFINLIFWRPKYLKVQYHAIIIILFRDWKKVMKARKESKKLRRIPWYSLLKKQEFFLKRDILNFYKFIIKGEKSYFEKY